MTRTAGVIFLVLGIGLLAFGLNATDAPMDRIHEAFTGRFTDSTMLYLILGTVGVVGGLVILSRRGA